MPSNWAEVTRCEAEQARQVRAVFELNLAGWQRRDNHEAGSGTGEAGGASSRSQYLVPTVIGSQVGRRSRSLELIRKGPTARGPRPPALAS